MHTAIVLGGGFSLLLTCLLLGHAFGGGMPGAVAGARLFIPLWLIGAGVNMWLGVSHAGYSAAEKADLFAGKGHEQHRPLPVRLAVSRQPRQLDYARGPRRVVVGAVMHLPDKGRRQRIAISKSQMIIMRADDNPLAR